MGRLGNIRVISGGLGCEESEVTFCKTEELKTEHSSRISHCGDRRKKNCTTYECEDSRVQQVYSQSVKALE